MSTSPQIFVFPAVDARATANLARTFLNPVALPTDLPSAGLRKGELIHAWGISSESQSARYWDVLEKGDWLLWVSHSYYRAVARIRGKLKDAALARQFWGHEGASWDLLVLVDSPARVGVPVHDLQGYLHKRYQGLARISDDRLGRITSDFGTIEQFLSKRLLTVESHLEITRDDVLHAIAEYDAGVRVAGFNPAMYHMLHEGRAYPPKLIYALASRHSRGRLLNSHEVDSGENSRCFSTLRLLGFLIERE